MKKVLVAGAEDLLEDTLSQSYLRKNIKLYVLI